VDDVCLWPFHAPTPPPGLLPPPRPCPRRDLAPVPEPALTLTANRLGNLGCGTITDVRRSISARRPNTTARAGL
jgi:hypothetical protein